MNIGSGLSRLYPAENAALAWRTWLGTSILIAAFVIHYSNALWSIYIRRSLRLTRWELTQVALGLCIPFLLMFHVIGTRIAESTLDVTVYYNTVFIAQWLHRPWLGAMQMIALITVWTHACIGIHYWLRTKRWYPAWRPALFTYGFLLPTLALAGYVSGGNQVVREANADPDFVRTAAEDSNITAQPARRSRILSNSSMRRARRRRSSTHRRRCCLRRCCW